jgi:hypothetical protein
VKQGGTAAAAPSKVGALIVASIKARRRISFIYHGERRIAEPQCLGLTATNAETLRGYLPAGGKISEPLFAVAKMSDFVVLDEHFTKPGPNYKKGDSAMRTIFAEL